MTRLDEFIVEKIDQHGHRDFIDIYVDLATRVYHTNIQEKIDDIVELRELSFASISIERARIVTF
jgi:hypothetical protein